MENKNDWRKIVKVDGHSKEALEALAKSLTGTAEGLAGADLRFIDNCQYITAVPLEIALTANARARIMALNPKCNWIVTSVDPSRVEKMINEYGYQLIVGIKAKEQPVQASKPVVKLKFTINGKTIETTLTGNEAEQNAAIDAFIKAAQKLV